MLLNEVDIYSCRFFTLNKDKKLQFCGGAHKGKTVEDFNTIPDLHKVTSYCFWIMKKEDIPMHSKYAAAAFLKALIPKYKDMEKMVREKALEQQKKLKKKTQELTKTTGKKYA